MSTVTNNTIDTNLIVDAKLTKNKKTSEPKAEKKPRAPKKVDEPNVNNPIVQEEQVSNSDTDELDTSDKKTRAPTLPAKYAKFIQFGFWFFKKLSDNSDAPSIGEALFNDKLKLFAEVDEQQAFVQEFFDASKDMNRDIRQIILQRKRDAIKSAKAEARATARAEAKATKAIANANAIANAADKVDAPKKPRAPRLKKDNNDDTADKKPPTKGKKKVLTDDAFVNEMVQLANGAELPTPPLVEQTSDVELTPDLTVTVTVPVTVPVPVPVPVPVKPIGKKSKADKPTKAKAVKNTNLDNKPTTNLPAHSSNDLQVSVLNLNDKQYLIDDDLNVYDFLSHIICAKFNPSDNSLTPI